ncbi:MAG: SurA N-terminal domain-containing protein [Candidatus Doudnabacteria bacterium]|nr:SurA N-terminal domain-containing protein [Candidatus Doudnabacteria bacterium]
MTENNTVSEFASAPSPKKSFNLKRFINYKVLALILAVVIVGSLAYYYKSFFVAATVNGKPISRWAVIKELEQQSGREALDSLITEKLISAEAKKQNVQVSEDEINVRIKQLEGQIAAQGGTLDEMLATQGVSKADLEDQIVLQVKAEKILGDKLNVTEEDVIKFVADSGQALEAGKEEEQKAQIRENIKQQKFNEQIVAWIDDARTKASINEFVTY